MPAADLADTLSPVDLPEPPAPLPNALGWTTTAIAVATLFLALLNANAIRGWSYQLPPDADSARVVTAAEGWYDMVGRAGLNRPVEAMHLWWQSARDKRFGAPPLASGAPARARRAAPRPAPAPPARPAKGRAA